MNKELSYSVDTIVVAYKSRDVIRACVLSLIDDPVVRKVVVVNNSPEDRLSDVLDDLDRVEIVPSTNNIGFGSAINSVRHLVEAPYVLLANPDCTTQKGTVDALADILVRNPRIGIAAARMSNPDGSLHQNSQRLTTLPMMIGKTL